MDAKEYMKENHSDLLDAMTKKMNPLATKIWFKAMEEYRQSKVNNSVLDGVIKCDYCGDVGRVEPTLQYPDGIKCYKCP